ncbi:hypothetical protein [Paraburkholderia flagellata]|uniref:hypothetical protein n=1 Tax=Paraburkholderia flagellata TaxID=2883241 RepID=UPI001F42B5B1|nr:hypothetical protein [Paraburkholderia flagellata]
MEKPAFTILSGPFYVSFRQINRPHRQQIKDARFANIYAEYRARTSVRQGQLQDPRWELTPLEIFPF